MKIRPIQSVAAMPPPSRKAYVVALKRAYTEGNLDLDIRANDIPTRLLEALFPPPWPQRA